MEQKGFVISKKSAEADFLSVYAERSAEPVVSFVLFVNTG